MTVIASLFLAAAAAAAEPVPAAPQGAEAEAGQPRTIRVTSDTSTFLRSQGIAVLTGNVFVDDSEFKMHADEVTLFFDIQTNAEDRAVAKAKPRAQRASSVRGDGLGRLDMDLVGVVAIGNVAVTNGTKCGSCAKATYLKKLGKVVLNGDAKTGTPAWLSDGGEHKSELQGEKIVYWIETDQVEVERSTITIDATGLDAKGGLKGLFGGESKEKEKGGRHGAKGPKQKHGEKAKDAGPDGGGKPEAAGPAGAEEPEGERN